MKTRRDFLQSTLAASASALVAPTLLAATDSTAAGVGVAPERTIDWHSHWLSPHSVELLKHRTAGLRIEQTPGHRASLIGPLAEPIPLTKAFFDVEARLRYLDRIGIDRQIISWPISNADAQLPIEEAKSLYRAYNDDLAALIRKHPARFSGLAAVPPADPDWAAEELDRAHRALGLIGAILPAATFQSRRALDRLAPIFRVAQERRSHIFVHPGSVASRRPGGPLPQPPEDDVPALRRALSTTDSLAVAAFTLTHSGFLEPYTNVTVQFALLGGGSPLLASWLALYDAKDRLGDGLGLLRRAHFDTGEYALAPHASEFAASTLGVGRILFGSDFPFEAADRTIAAIRSSSLTVDDVNQVFVKNGRELLGRIGKSSG